jgi:glycosyltransferase involved in cell wall biosynthesis
MVSGSGVKNKLLEAMSIGRPIVTTSLGVESLDLVPGRDLLVADDPAAYAEALDRLLGDPELQARLGPPRANGWWPRTPGTPAPRVTTSCTRTWRRSPRVNGRPEWRWLPTRAAGIPFGSPT